MDYQETLNYLYNSAPLFQHVGAGAYKEGLSNTHALDEHFGHPHQTFRTIHVAGTNGKGSCSHTLAGFTQVGSFISYGDSQIVHPVIFQCFGYFKRTGSVGRSFYHAYHFCFRFQFISVVIQIIN